MPWAGDLLRLVSYTYNSNDDQRAGMLLVWQRRFGSLTRYDAVAFIAVD